MERSIKGFVVAVFFGLLMGGGLVVAPASSTTVLSQLGLDIDGESAGDESGSVVSLSSDGSRVAVGAPYNDGNGADAGQVRVYQLQSGSWVQLGSDIDGESAGDRSGYSVSLSSDGSRVAIGATLNDGNGSSAGHVRVFDWDGSTWTQVGSDIDGEAAGDQSGRAVSLSSDGSRVAVGARVNDGTGSAAGHVRVFDLIGSTWTQVGSDIDGEAAGDQSGRAVSLSSDGSRVAVGAHLNAGNGSGAGHVRVYELQGGSWVKVGSDIDGEAAGDQSGYSVSLSSDGSRVAIGANLNDGTGSYAGHVRVFELIGSSWTQVGLDIDGEAAGDQSGYSVSLSSSGSRVAIGAPVNDGNGSSAGHVRVFDWDGSAWTQVASDIDGEAAGDESGHSVSLASNGSGVAIGAPLNDDAGNAAGHTRVLAFSTPESEPSQAEEAPGAPGIYLYVAGGAGSPVAGTEIHHGSFAVAPNSLYSLTIEPLVSASVSKTVLASGVTSSGGHAEGETSLGALPAGSYKIVMSGTDQSGIRLALTNHITVNAAGEFVSVSPESLQPMLR